jgi:hypothetical protein
VPDNLYIELEPLSTTKIEPDESQARPFGLFNPEELIVVTTPAVVTIQIRLFAESDTYRLLAGPGPRHIFLGALNLATFPVPTALPEVPGNPARVSTLLG